VSPSPGGGRDRGSGEVLGLVLVVPVALGVALLVLLLGRHVDSRAQVRSAAEASAQAAAQQRDPAAALAAARRVAAAMLGDTSTCRSGAAVDLDASSFEPGGHVAVTVRCAPSSSGLGPVHGPDVTYAATAIAVIDVHRAAGLR
jgi:hypothetical protein